MIVKVLIYSFILTNTFTPQAMGFGGAVTCAQVYVSKNFESLRSDFGHLENSVLGDRTFIYELRDALSRLDEGVAKEEDLLTILKYGDPVSIAATLKWSQGKTEKALWDIVRLLEQQEIQPKILKGEIPINHFFRQRLAPWFDLVPKDLLSRLLVASLGGDIKKASFKSASAILPRLPELVNVLGMDSPVILALTLRSLESPRSLSLSTEIHRLPENVQHQFTENWRVDSHRPELVVKDIKLLSFENKKKLLAEKNLIDCGTCPQMARGHFEPFFKDNGGKGTSLILYRGELIGLLKTTGDPSFLALRDVKNGNGDLILLTGGVYFPPLWVINKLEVSFHPLPTHTVQVLDLFFANQGTVSENSLSFYPMMFMKAPLEAHQMPGFLQFESSAVEGSIRRSYGFSMDPIESVRGEEFKDGIIELRRRAQAILEQERR